MRTIFPLLTASLLLCSCVPPQNVTIDGQDTSSPVVHRQASSVALSEAPIELAIETDETSSSSAATGTGALAERMVERGVLEIGSPDAPLALTVFTNYSCDYCKEFMRDLLPQLETDLIATGKLRLQFVLVPLKKYPNSTAEAASLLCAAVLGKGQMMDAAMREAPLRDRKSLLALAKKIALPAKEFTACLDAKETKNLLAAQQSFINDHGVTLIPAFMINNEKLTGLPSYADLRGWINERLAQ